LATGLVTLAVLAFSIFFISYLTGLQDAYLTHAEDLGTMDQAIWSTLHGQLLRQTICNPIGDTNCAGPGGISRFALHVEPILFLISPLYLLFPSPKTLQVLQTLIVASGAFPAFWLARLRLRNEWAGVSMAILYLLYPAQQHATVFDFHAVTFTASFLLFVLYFLYTRRTILLFVFALLAMACKEEIAALIALCGLWSLLFQQRWRSGLALIALAFGWTAAALVVLHLASPSGFSLLSSRYAAIGSGPLQILRTLLLHPGETLERYVLEHNHLFYLRLLLAPGGYLALLAPWVLVLALPTLVLNLLSADVSMYSGLYQYNAEIVPFLLFACIEAQVLLLWLTRRCLVSLSRRKWITQTVQWSQSRLPASSSQWLFQRRIHTGFLALLLLYILGSALRAAYFHGNMPFSQGFQWPQTSSHTALARSLLTRIPSTASVSAQSALVPHLSHRTHIYLFPYAATTADYVLLDVTSDIYPFYSSSDYIRTVKQLLLNGTHSLVVAQDGYILLKHGVSAPGASSSPAVPVDSADSAILTPNLPDSFCSYIVAPSRPIPHPVDVAFQRLHTASPTLGLRGFEIDAPNPFSMSTGTFSITTYWSVLKPVHVPLQITILLIDKHGQEYFVSTDVPSVFWCPTQTWKPGVIIRLQSRVISLQGLHFPLGPMHAAIALIPLWQPTTNLMDVQVRRPIQVLKSPPTISVTQETKALQLVPLTLVP
jgi:uncharacterized membrane protein